MPDSPAKIFSLFIGIAESFSTDPPKSPTPRPSRNFDDGAVGLGIVASMIGPGLGGAPARSGPIQIVYGRPAAKWGLPIPTKEEEMEMSECYTCVISHVGGKPVRKRVYFDGGGGGGGGCKGDPRVFCVSLPPVELALPSPVGDFLSRCCMCRKDLYGLDIFMYRGDKAFCSVECRSQQIVSDEHMENRGSKAMMKPHFDCSLSPCSALLFFAAGVAAA